MTNILQNSRAVESQLRDAWKTSRPLVREAADTISELCTALEAEQKLSVTNIMLYVSPGWDGMGHEVYAKSVDEVVEVLSKLGCQAEDTQGDLYTARVKLNAAASTLDLLKEARKIIRASSSRSITKDWDERATAAIKAQGEKNETA